MANYFFEKYRPEICRGLHKWCCEQILRHLRLFRAKKIFSKIGNFWLFLHIRGHRFLEKWLTTFFKKSVTPDMQKKSKNFQFLKKIFFARNNLKCLKICSQHRPEICRGLHKWCCEQILRHLRLFRAKKIFFKNWKFFDFFCISGVTDFLKNG